MFDFLNKPTHSHAKNQSPPKIQQQQKILNKNISQLNSHEKIKRKPTLQDKLFPAFQPVKEITDKKRINYPSSNLWQHQQLPSVKAMDIFKNVLGDCQKSYKFSSYLTQKLYLARQRVQQNVYNYAISDGMNKFVGGVLEIQENFFQTDVPKLEEVKSVKSKGKSIVIEIPIEKQYNPHILQVFTKYIKGLENIIYGTVQNIYNDILDPNKSNKYNVYRKIPMKKDDLKHLYALDQKRLLSLKNKHKTIQGNLSSLRGDMQNSLLSNKKGLLQVAISKNKNSIESLKQIYQIDEDLLKNDKNYYNFNHPKTKQANEFIKNLQTQQQMQRAKYFEHLRKEREQYKRRMQQNQIYREKARSQRHERLKQEFIQKQQSKIRRKQIENMKKKQFQQFLKEFKHRTPLFVQKQQQYRRVQEQQQQLAKQKLKMRKKIFIPIDHDDLFEHQQKYLQLKAERKQKREAEKEAMINNAKQNIEDMKHNYHYGIFHNLVQQQIAEQKKKFLEDPKKQVKQLYIRKQAYGQIIKRYYKPKIDPQKRSQSLSFINQSLPGSVGNSKRYDNNVVIDSEGDLYVLSNSKPRFRHNEHQQQPDSKKDGLRNLRMLKQHIRQQEQKGNITRKSEKVSQSITKSATIQPKINYLQQLKEKRKQQGRKDSASRVVQQIRKIDSQKKDAGLLKVRAESLDAKAKMQQKKLKHNAHTAAQQAQLEQNYIEAIRLKIQLMQRYD